jgi:NADP-dependent aldehyde dehydrogenase
VDATTGDRLEPAFETTSAAEIARVCEAAGEAFDTYRNLPRETRARFLEAIADEIEAIGLALTERGMAETGLPRARLEGERGRTTGQLRLFAEVIRKEQDLALRFDPALPDRQPPRPELRSRRIPVGPVAVFAASNFPLAFSVAGGDTASALAAGCPVVVKAHPAHPGVSRLVADAVKAAAVATGVPDAVFSVIYEAGYEGGLTLVGHPAIKAVGFTGSRRGGLALIDAAARRDEPIPVFAEMSSINPVILLPGALAERAATIGQGFAAALTLGAGQFCTNPGLVIVVREAGATDVETFLSSAANALSETATAPMLTSGIRTAYADGLQALGAHPEVTQVLNRDEPQARLAGPALFTTSAAAFREHPGLHNEIFGAAALVVECTDIRELTAVLEILEGQLTAAVHFAETDHDAVRALTPVLERKAGRLVANGFGTGVEVSTAMVHGGPWPATSDSRTSSVGTYAIERFLRPVCYQGFPLGLLPDDFSR